MRTRALLTLVAALALAQAPLAQGGALKLATVVPDGSIWDKNLEQMAAEVQQATAGRVAITVFSGGSQGDEPAVLRKMRLNSLDAASFTVVGLANIDGAFNVFNMPFFLESYEELNFVVDRLTPMLTKRLDDKGFVFLNWGHGGWLQVFSRQPITTLPELKKARLWTSAGGDQMTQWYKANGFNPSALAMTDILMGLTTGMIDALPTPPIAAMAFQWNKQAPYMLDIGLTPVVGATVISKRAWTRLSAADRETLAASAKAVEARLHKEVPNQDRFAVALMSNQGLKVTKAEGPEWKTEAAKLADTMRGQMVPRDVFDLALKERDAFRQQRKK
jgi:TRAP-type C4-dicarboxylate transport system substrate-binding protein